MLLALGTSASLLLIMFYNIYTCNVDLFVKIAANTTDSEPIAKRSKSAVAMDSPTACTSGYVSDGVDNGANAIAVSSSNANTVHKAQLNYVAQCLKVYLIRCCLPPDTCIIM